MPFCNLLYTIAYTMLLLLAEPREIYDEVLYVLNTCNFIRRSLLAFHNLLYLVMNYIDFACLPEKFPTLLFASS